MPIRSRTPQTQIAAEFAEFERQITQKAIKKLQYVGEACINAARDWRAQAHPYKDDTGNLRSSLGYVIAVDGKIGFVSSFEVVEKGEQGAKDGIEYAKQLAREYPNDIVLIMVAGKNYASYVANRGYDVLDSAEILAKKIAPKLLKGLFK